MTKDKQITLHFRGEYIEILDEFKKRAKKNFRSTEQEILFELNGIFNIIKDNESKAPSQYDLDEMARQFDISESDDVTVAINGSTETEIIKD